MAAWQPNDLPHPMAAHDSSLCGLLLRRNRKKSHTYADCATPNDLEKKFVGGVSPGRERWAKIARGHMAARREPIFSTLL